MKILHIISSGGMYGAEAVILNLLRSLNHSEHASSLGVFCNAANPNLQLHESVLKEGFESNLIPCKGQIDRTVVGRIRELAAQCDADVVHAHGFKADVYTYLAVRRMGISLVSTCHTWYDNDLAVTFYGMVDRWILRKYARVVAVSDEVEGRLLKAGVRKERIRLIRNGIDLRPFTGAAPSLRDGLEPDGLLVGLIGRLSREKGIDIFLRAAAQVAATLPNVRFLIVGDGPDRSQLESLIDDLGMRERAAILGHRDDMPSVYASLDVMVSSSRQEGLPIAILEGMASGRALVATAVGQVPAAVLNDRTGILVPAEDVDLLAARVLEMLRDSALRQRLGAAARQLIEDEFSAGRMAEDYLQVYASALTAKNAVLL